jgi:NADH-quinone oxidoreductase subunit G
VGTIVGGQASNEEGHLLARLSREALHSSDIDSRGAGPHPPIPTALARSLAAPELQASVTDLEFAHTVLLVGCDPRDDAPILDLRLRKGVRRNGVTLAIASARPTALDANASVIHRYVPGGDDAFVAELDRALAGVDGVGEGAYALASLLREGGEDVVIVYGERIGAAAATALRRIAERLAVEDHPGAGLLALPAGANGRGLREAGVVPDAGPGYAPLERGGRGAAEIGAAAADGEITALHLFQTDPVRDLPDRALWERALGAAALVVAHASVLTEGLREHATVIFPAESHAEKEGTVVHPDGRLQRLRIAIAHPDEVRPGWAALAEIARRCGLDTGVERSADAFAQLAEAIPFYAGLTLEEIGGRGVRWPERAERAASMRLGAGGPVPGAFVTTSPPAPPASNNGAQTALRLGTYRPIWAAPECEISPALKFLIPHQQVELSPDDAARLGVADGEDVVVAQNGTRLAATAVIRAAIPAGSAFLAEGLVSQSANILTEPLIEVRRA